MKRKMVALLAIATMLLSTVPVSAAETEEYTGSVGGTEISGAGAVVDYDKTPIYRVTLPTSTALDFMIDPYGLMQMATGSANGRNFENATGTAALVVATDASLNIVNKSSVPVLVDSKFTVTNDGSAKLVTSESALTDASGAATEAGLYLTLKGSTASAKDVSGASWASEPIVLAAGSKAVQFKLDKATYKVVRTDTASGSATFALEYDATSDTNFDGTVLQIAGAVNKADWTEYVSGGKSIGISAVFSYRQCESDVETTGTIHGLVSGEAVTAKGLTVDWVAKEVTYWIYDEDGEAFDSVPSDTVVKVNGNVCSWKNVNGFISVTWSQVEAAGAGDDPTFEFVVTMNGETYTNNSVVNMK